MSTLVEISIALAQRENVPVFPCKVNKSPACPHGHKDATKDPEEIAALFGQHPGSLIGMPTGAQSGISVLDIDLPKGESWWHANQPILPNTRIVRTRGGGLHYYFRHRNGLRCSASQIAPGIDVRADGGYVIRWDLEGLPILLDAPLADWPDGLHSPATVTAPVATPSFANGATPPPPVIMLPDAEAWSARATLNEAWARVSTALEGSRNDALNRHAYLVAQYVAEGSIDRVEATEFLVQAAEAAGLGRAEASRTIASAFTAATRPPAPPPPTIAVLPIFDLRLPGGPIAVWQHAPPPPPTFAVEDFARIGATTLLAGEGGAGKSYIALAAMIAVGTGGPFFGKRTLAGRAVGVFGEHSEGALYARVNRICAAHRTSSANLAGLVLPLSVADDPSRALLWQNEQPTPALLDLESQCRAVPDLRLVVIDNATLLADLDENVRREVAAFLGYLNGMAARLQCSILLIHHAAKSHDGSSLRMASGSTAWINQVRCAAELRKASGNEPTRFAVRKINDGHEWSVDLVWSTEGALISADAAEPQQRAEDAFLDALRTLSRRGQRAAQAKQSPYYAPKAMVGMQEAAGLTKPQLADAMNRLLDMGRIKSAIVGRGANRQDQQGLVICDPEPSAQGCSGSTDRIT